MASAGRMRLALTCFFRVGSGNGLYSAIQFSSPLRYLLLLLTERLPCQGCGITKPGLPNADALETIESLFPP